MAERVPVSELVDLTRLGSTRGSPRPSEIRAALPRGWVLEDDGLHAKRDMRLAFREGWMLVLAMISFGAVGFGFLWGAMPRGWA